MAKSIIAILGFLSISLGALAQQVTFEAYADAKQITENGYVELSFTLENADGNSFQPPSLADFEIVGGPSKSVSTTIINGAVSRKFSISYTLKPLRKGDFTIGSASIRVDGKTYKTKPLTIQVVAAGSTAGVTGNGEVFLRAIPQTEPVYVGQQVLVDYKIYTSVDIENYNILEESNYQKFYAQDVRRYDGRIMREVVNGKQYTTKVLKRVALFPQQAGKLSVEPLELQLGVVKAGDSDEFFFNRQMRRIAVASEPLEIDVRPLPPNAPPSFSGAVGDYSFISAISRNVLTTDDALTIQLSITGNGDIKRLQPPPLNLGDDFEVYEPKIVQEQLLEQQGGLEGRKIVEYIAIPKRPGEYRIQPEFTYFDPIRTQYITLAGEVAMVTVRQGMNKPTVSALPEGQDGVNQDIRYIKTEASFTQNRTPFFGSVVFWSLATTPFLGFLGIVLIKRMNQKRENIDPLLLRSRQAQKVAQQHLAAAKQHLMQNQPRAFYDEVSRAMQGYICDKLNLPTSDLTKENIREKLHSLQVSQEQIDRFLKIIQTCEMALFARQENAEAMQTTYDNAIDVVAKIEEGISLAVNG